MNILWFLAQVWKMRKYQIAYFKDGRRWSDLIEAKKFEKVVDAELVKRLIIVGGEPGELRIEQENLFTEDGNEAK